MLEKMEELVKKLQQQTEIGTNGGGGVDSTWVSQFIQNW